MPKQSMQFYNRFSIFYPAVDLFLRPQKKKLLQEINTQPVGHLLEIGVGNGTHLKFYKNHSVVGIDTSSKMLEVAKKQSYKNVELLEMNGEYLLFPNETFDYVVLCHVIAVVSDPEKLLEETNRVLKPGGKIFILNHFTPQNWLQYIDRSFQVISKLFHFRSVFYIERLQAMKRFRLLKEISFGRFVYFKLLVYSKP